MTSIGFQGSLERTPGALFRAMGTLYDFVHVRQELRPPRPLPVLLELRQRLLLHGITRVTSQCSIRHYR